MLSTLAAIGWEPEIRGALTVILSIVILCGSVYLIIATNTGARLGFLIAFTGLMGWMLLMGIIWTIYGIGYKGSDPTWQVQEVVEGDLSQAEQEKARSLEGWRELTEGGGRGEAQAAADAYLLETDLFTDDEGEPQAYVGVSAYERGGKDRLVGDPACSFHRPDTWDGCWDRITHKLETTLLEPIHPERLAIVQVQQARDTAQAGAAAEADPSAPTISVIMARDLGNLRQRPILLTAISGILFGLGAYQLHRRDLKAMAARAAVGS
jgi:hypothetical protein